MSAGEKASPRNGYFISVLFQKFYNIFRPTGAMLDLKPSPQLAESPDKNNRARRILYNMGFVFPLK